MLIRWLGCNVTVFVDALYTAEVTRIVRPCRAHDAIVARVLGRGRVERLIEGQHDCRWHRMVAVADDFGDLGTVNHGGGYDFFHDVRGTGGERGVTAVGGRDRVLTLR